MALLNLFAAAVLAAAPDPATASLIAAERGFAADGQRDGLRRAFLAHFDAESWLFRPYPVPALPTLARDADDAGFLQWEPDFVGVSASGDLGFSSGPWTVIQPGVGQMLYGHFLSVWKRGKDGVWRVQVDGGVVHAPLTRAAGKVTTVPTTTASATPLDAAALNERGRLLDRADDALRESLARNDAKSPLPAHADSSLHVLRDDKLPADGAAALELVAKDPPGLGRAPRLARDVAASGDLGYTLGGERNCKGCGSYLRVWRWEDGRWRVAVDFSTAQP